MSRWAIAPADGAGDLAAVRALFRAYAGSLGFDLGFQGFEAELASLPGKYAPPAGALLLARLDGVAVGCVALRDLGAGACEMKRLYLAPAARGHGIGAALVERAIAAARAAGYAVMRLDTVPGEHDAAIGLYRKRGFSEIPAYCFNPMPGAKFFELRLSA